MQKLLLWLKNKILIIGLLIAFLSYLCHKLLNLFQLEFRQWFIYSAIIISSILIIVGAFQLMLKIKMKAVKIPLVIVSTILLFITCPYIILLGAFGYHPEHVVIKEDIKLVGYVYAFKQVRVEYYDYKNFIIIGAQLRLYEDYGKGGYDPIETSTNSSILEADTYIWYDDNGEPIE